MSRLNGPPGLINAAVLVSKGVIGLIWLGMATCVFSLIRQWMRGDARPAPRSVSAARPDFASARATIIAICLACLLLQILLAISLRVPPYPQYCFGTFPIHVLFAWFAIDWLRRVRLGMLVTLAWGLSLGYITLGSAWQIHRHGWNRYCMSPTLENQAQIARQLNGYSDETILTNVAMYGSYPMALRELRVILPGEAAAAHSPHGLLLRYAASSDPASSQIELIEIRAASDVPADALKLDVTPMPPAY